MADNGDTAANYDLCVNVLSSPFPLEDLFLGEDELVSDNFVSITGVFVDHTTGPFTLKLQSL